MSVSTLTPDKHVSPPLFGREFNGKVAIVSGAFQGIGAAIADNLTALGAIVIRVDIAYAEKREKCYAVDVTNTNDVNKIVDYIEKNHGPIEFAVNAAGILRMGNLLNTPQEDWLNTFAVNTTGAFNFCRAVGQKMARRKKYTVNVLNVFGIYFSIGYQNLIIRILIRNNHTVIMRYSFMRMEHFEVKNS